MTPIEKVLFRASGSGALMTKKQGTGITEGQLARIKELENERDFGVNVNGNKVKWVGTKKPEELSELIAKRDAPPELSETAKAFIRRVWLENKKGFRKQIKSKYLEKGLYSEEDAISLLSDVDSLLYGKNIIYYKNEKREFNENHSGECDIIKTIDGVRIVQDTKCCYDPETFMSSGEDPIYEWQLRIYMELYDAEEGWLRYCLVDAPAHLVAKEKEFAKRKFIDDSLTIEEANQVEEMMQPIFDQIDLNMVYTNNPAYTKEERVKTFKYYRDKSKINEMNEAVKLGRIYYAGLKLNGIY